MDDLAVPVWRDNLIDRKEMFLLSELAARFDASEYSGDEYRNAWPLRRCLAASFSNWAVIESAEFELLLDYIVAEST